VDTIVTSVQPGQMILILGKNWLTHGGNILVINTILQKTLLAKDARVKVIKLLTNNAKLDPALEREVLKVAPNATNFRARK
jgi:hypothetical protein